MPAPSPLPRWLLRALILAAALAIPLLMSVEAITGLIGEGAIWVGPVLVALCGVPVVYVAAHRGQAVVGVSLAAMAAATSLEVPELLRETGDPEAMAVHDLRARPLPAAEAQVGRVVQLQGYLRDEWVVDEYRVADGERPDQNRRAEAVLLPLLGTQAETVSAEQGLLVVARVRPELLEGPKLQTLRGRLGEVPPEIADSLFAVQGGDPAQLRRPPTVLLDTFELPTRAQALTRAALALGAALLGLILMLTALGKAGAGETKGKEADLA